MQVSTRKEDNLAYLSEFLAGLNPVPVHNCPGADVSISGPVMFQRNRVMHEPERAQVLKSLPSLTEGLCFLCCPSVLPDGLFSR